MKQKTNNNKEYSYAVAFVHTPSNETGRTEFVFTRVNASQICDELDGVCPTILHFVLEQGEDIHVKAEQRKHASHK